MKKLLISIAFFCVANAFCQQDAWVYFADKPDAQFYLDNPLEMLSQRSLDRRASQNITLDETDVPISQSYIDAVDAVPGISVLAKSKWLNAVHVRGSQSQINFLSGFDFVASVDFADHSLNPDSGRASKTRSVAASHSTAKNFDTQVEFNYGSSANQIQMLNGHLLHGQDFTGQGKIIAVLDAGFPNVDNTEPFQRLWTNNLILGGYNFVDRNEQVFTRNNHGTLVLSTMGGYSSGQLVGTAPDAGYYLFITEAIEYENPVEESFWAEAAEMADSLGVDVINTSLGYPDYDNPAYNYSYEQRNGTTAFISRAADIAFSKGMVVVVSAGNEGGSEDNHISVPADAHHVLTVGAVTPAEMYAAFSSIGPTADGRVKPDVVAQGQSAVIADTSGAISTSSGTSFSGPIIAGMVATFWSAVPELTNQQVVDFIRQSADLYNNPTPQKGYGVPDFALALENALSVPGPLRASLLLWPNPVAGALSVKLPDGMAEATFVIYDGLGQAISKTSVSVHNPTVDCSGLASGIYVYGLTGESQKYTGKLIKN